MAWIAEQEKKVEHLVSVCTSAYVLAELGRLQPVEPTAHYSGYDRLQKARTQALIAS